MNGEYEPQTFTDEQLINSNTLKKLSVLSRMNPKYKRQDGGRRRIGLITGLLG